MDAGGFVDVGDDFVIQIQNAPVLDTRRGVAAKVVQRFKAFIFHPFHQAASHCLDDAEAAMHRRGADLHAA